ncbi:MAG: hypothetical protein ACJA09_003618 [Alcanivorax sp.]|jgi:hypothetical protein
MKSRLALAVLVPAVLVSIGCTPSRNFSASEDDIYSISQSAPLCASVTSSKILEDIRNQAAEFCAGRKEVPVEVSNEMIGGITAVRCASATLRFKCDPAP